MKLTLEFRILILAGLIVALPAVTEAQSFEGTITYVNDFMVSKKFQDMGITKEVLQEEMKKDNTWFDTAYVSYKQGNYFFLTSNNMRKIYKADVNKIYAFDNQEEDICTVQEGVDLDMSGKPDKPEVIALDSMATIMGLSCQIIRMKWKISHVDFYYNTNLANVDPSLFAKHSYEGFSEFVSRSKCLPLQVVREAIGMTIIQTAVRVTPQEVKANVFDVPNLVEDKDLNTFKLPGMTIMRVKK